MTRNAHCRNVLAAAEEFIFQILKRSLWLNHRGHTAEWGVESGVGGVFSNWLHTFPKNPKDFLSKPSASEIPPVNPETIPLTPRAFHTKRPLPTNSLNINCEIARCGLWRVMSELDCGPFLIITALHLLPAERSSHFPAEGCRCLASISRPCREISQGRRRMMVFTRQRLALR